jgi:general secretion pathway protein D
LAIALKYAILNNGVVAGTIFDNFLPGRMLAMQAIVPNWERILESSVALYFVIEELFDPLFFDAHEKALRDLDSTLRKAEMQSLVEGIKLP